MNDKEFNALAEATLQQSKKNHRPALRARSIYR